MSITHRASHTRKELNYHMGRMAHAIGAEKEAMHGIFPIIKLP
jgi:hypothetical protein